MAIVGFLDNVIFTPTAGGTTDWVVSAAVQGYLTPAQANAADQKVYWYHAQSADQTQWEIGYGAYTVSSTTLARATVVWSSSSNSKVNFTAAPFVGIVHPAENIVPTFNEAALYAHAGLGGL